MRLTSSISLLVDSFLSLLYPQQCSLCGAIVEFRADGIACSSCWSNTRMFDDSTTLCWKCGRPTIKNVSVAEAESVRCGVCDEDSFAAVRACGVYEGALKSIVLSLKREPDLCERLVSKLSQLQQTLPLRRATVVMPVPLHPIRERMRGFNQAAVIGTRLARANRIPFCESNLIRVAHSEHYRAGMDARGRRESVRSAFQVRHPAVIAGEHILLVDDVYTTGATVSACSAALLEAGAAEVLVLTIARAG